MRVYIGNRGDSYEDGNNPGIPCPTIVRGVRPYPTRRASFTPIAMNNGVRFDLPPDVVTAANRLMPLMGPVYVDPRIARNLPWAGVNNLTMRGFRDDGIPIPGLGF